MKVNELNKTIKTAKLHTLKKGDTFRLEENGPIHMVCTAASTNWVEVARDRVVCVRLEDGSLSGPVEGISVIPVKVEANVIKDSK
ncbi:hypothetical protein PQC55_gp102 [Escherichia phage vB_EcoP-CHD5UKE1]|uniref:Uncharacterized protein n=2 Tax=Kuravirus SU10 TaxID=1987942 RepID=A0A0B4N0F7_9CAUD|nr:hypothetical protein ACQ52_gp098 [Escherichia phage vB_EcoP_SU10]YP_010674008.1 hypothetical protein PQC55_gp102 [Escherichia phage vB_EcoP-CHD5UKE1]AIF71850.1 hypothetical protein SU10_098 [Escherichia phage vB_EcoP_SU10]QZI80598.1 hypothetical protein CHD5UKE1_102 [Escherichia phage vB_EcoP-CHD5UKE1]